MATARFRQTDEAKAAQPLGVTEPLAAKVSVPVAIRQEKARPASMLGVVVFFLLIGAAIGSVFYLHETKVKRQKQLYAQYLSQNSAWRKPIESEYAKVTPFLDEFERVNPSKETNWTKVNSDFQKFRVVDASLRGNGFNGSLSSAAVQFRAGMMLNVYEWAFSFARLPADLEAGRGDRFRAGYALWAWKHYPNWGESPRDPFQVVRGDADNIEFRKFMQQPDKDLARQLKDKFSKDVDVWGPAKAARKDFEEALATRNDVPDGLDLEYAKKLR